MGRRVFEDLFCEGGKDKCEWGREVEGLCIR